MSTQSAVSGLGRTAQLPQFIVDRVAQFQSDRFRADGKAHALVIGPPPGAGDIDLKSNDYLAIGRHPAVVAAQVGELKASGSQQMMSAFFLNRDSAQWDLERGFAELLGAAATVLFQSGYLANTGLLQTIADATIPVYPDQLAHASLYQGALVAGAPIRPFRHNDAEHLQRQIRTHGPGVIVIDSVYSTDGSLAPIADVLEVAETMGCALLVDESHSLGTHGPGGAGLVVGLGLAQRVHFRTASLAKACCGRAGIVACPQRFADYLRFASFPNIFSSSVLPHELAALAKTLELIRRDDWRRERLHANADWLRGHLDELGYNVSASGSQIIALEAGPEENAVRLALALQAKGVFGAIFFSPATPKNRACLRLSVHAGLAPGDLERTVAACAAVRDEVGMAEWASTRRKHRPEARRRRVLRTAAGSHGVLPDSLAGAPRQRVPSDLARHHLNRA